MRVAIHQPDLLPYSGFWFKMATVDRFVIAQHDQFQKHGYQRRVTMRDAWCSLRLVGKPALVPITSVEVAPGWQQGLVDVVRGRYTGARHWRERGPDLCERILSSSGTSLVEVNLALIGVVRDLLGIDTELVVTDPPTGAGLERLVEEVRMVGGTAYVSGPGGASYLGDDAVARFAAAGIDLEWSGHVATTGESIVTVLMDHDEPMEIILRRR